MLFNSYVFVLAFLPITLAGYFFLNKVKLPRCAQAWLTLASLVFYAWFNFWYVFIILGSILANFFMGRFLLYAKTKIVKRVWLWVGILLNLGMLGYYKYFNFFLDNLNNLFDTSFVLRNILLPLGISFFTFQQLSYVIDCYRGNAEKYGFIEYALFVSFFPQLIAGPIVLHTELVPQFRDASKRRFNIENFSAGLMTFSRGMAKKVLLADSFGRGADWGYSNVWSLNSSSTAIVILCYTLQIYFDFSGYCDMATGLAKMFNFSLPQNFNSPYKAITPADFWKRWHMTLTRFFTQYMYIPLGGNRRGPVRRYINMMLVFLVSGLWHGANWTFVLWGAVNGLAVVFSNVFSKVIAKIPRWICWAATFLFANLAWVLFRANSALDAVNMYSRLLLGGLGLPNSTLVSEILPFAIKQPLTLFFSNSGALDTIFLAVIIIGLACAVFGCVFFKNSNQKLDDFRPTLSSALTSSFILLWSIFSFAGVSSFLYFNF